MKRYLLFNSNCEMCSQIALELERELGGWLEVKSLNDSSIKKYLNSNHPGWSLEPMLLLQSNEGKQKLLTGFNMKLFLIRKLGINRAIKIAELVSQFEETYPSGSHINHHRRAFLQTSIPGFFGAILALKTPQFPKQNQAVGILPANSTHNQNDVGDLYYGFILLPDVDTPTPSYVHLPQMHGRTINSFSNEEDLRKAIPFGLYKAGSKYSDLPFLNAQQSILEEDDGVTTDATVNYGELAYFSEELETDRMISLIIHNKPYYPSPYPIYPVHEQNVDTGEVDLIAPEKIRVGTAFGVLVPSSNGYVAHWIEKGVLYTLAVEDSTNRETMLQILSNLVEI